MAWLEREINTNNFITLNFIKTILYLAQMKLNNN